MELKRLSDLFWKSSPNLFFLSTLFGGMTGVLYALLIPFVMYSIGTDVSGEMPDPGQTFSYFHSPTAALAAAFLVTCLFIVLMKGLFTVLSMYVANRASVEHRLWLYRRIQRLPLADLERIGHSRLINILNLDIPAITAGSVALPQIWISIITILGVMGYLIQLNSRVFIFVMLSLLAAVLTYQLPLLLATRLFTRSRDGYDRVQQGVEGLVHGAKELKLNRQKAEAYFHAELLQPEKGLLRDNLKGNALLVFIHSYGELISFLVIGVVVFHYRYTFMMSSAELLGIAMALLYLVGPVGVILSSMASVRHARIALKKLHHFYEELTEPTDAHDSTIPPWQCIQIDGLSYSYAKSDQSFALSGVNLRFDRGQISFIVGGNGSGKSTLSKCLSLHYTPTAGCIAFGETTVDAGNIHSARQFVSAIFSDYYLFKRLYLSAGQVNYEKAATYLKYLELDKKVALVGDQFTTIDLSDGQRKRLALLVMLLEDRDVCIFDEWAADQDPRFKEIFYAVILPDLKARNKVVIVISHDDRYYRYADQVIVMANGTVDSVTAGGVTPRLVSA